MLIEIKDRPSNFLLKISVKIVQELFNERRTNRMVRIQVLGQKEKEKKAQKSKIFFKI